MDLLPISLFSVVLEEKRNGTHMSPREQKRANSVVIPASKQSRGEDRGVPQPGRESSAVTKTASRVVEKSRGPQQGRGEDRGVPQPGRERSAVGRGVPQPGRKHSAVTKAASRVVEKSREPQQETKRSNVEKVGEEDEQLTQQVSHDCTLLRYYAPVVSSCITIQWLHV